MGKMASQLVYTCKGLVHQCTPVMTITLGKQLGHSMLFTGEYTRYRSYPHIETDPARWSKLLKIAHDALVFVFPHAVPHLTVMGPNKYVARAHVGPKQELAWIRITTRPHEFRIQLKGYKPTADEIENVMRC